MRWLRKKHPKLTWKQLRRRSFAKDSIKAGTITLYIPASMRILRYRYRGAQICTPWNNSNLDHRGGRNRRITNDDPRFLAPPAHKVMHSHGHKWGILAVLDT